MTQKIKKNHRSSTYRSTSSILIIMILFFQINYGFAQNNPAYQIVETHQELFYDTIIEIVEPIPGEPFYGQDANYTGNQPTYVDNGDGTVTDLVTGLMWQQSPDMDGDGDIDYEDKMSYDEAMAGAATFNLAGYTDWRLPSIKEMYSLILFSGVDPSGYNGTSTEDLVPFIDTNYFDFAYGDQAAGERIIDAQMASSTLYISENGMGGQELMFGVNFADGRIKGYPTGPMPGQTEDKQFYIMYVRENPDYCVNDFQDNGDGTITDNATYLMWTQDDDGEGMIWEDALNYAENSVIAGHSDWRLPNAKELQSILDYTRAPSVTNSAAIDPIFNCTAITDEGGNINYPFYWSGTTHASWQEDAPGGFGAYVCFGEALGWMEMPPNSGNYELWDVHGAGAQRSDPKVGDPDNYPYGHGPQGDVVRIFNFVRLVRDTESGGSTQIIELNEGYQFVSSRIEVENPDMLVVLENILNDNLDFVRNSNGEVLRKIGPNWVNGIGDWITKEGYLFKMNSEDEFSIIGEVINPQTPIDLFTGYQFVSYLPETAIDALVAFEGILTDDLDYIRNSYGGMLRKIGPNWVNGIGDANPGEGYLIKMFTEGELIYNISVKSKLSTLTPEIAYNFDFKTGNAADPVYTLYVSGLNIGDEIAVFDGNKIVGTSVITSENVLENSVPVFFTLTNGKGYETGNPISIIIWDFQDQTEVSATYTFDYGYAKSYTKTTFPSNDGEFSVINISKNSSGIEDNTLSEISVYPNPATDHITVNITNSNSGISTFQILNLLGEVVYSVSKEFTETTSININCLEPGLYFIKIENNGSVFSKKFIKK